MRMFLYFMILLTAFSITGFSQEKTLLEDNFKNNKNGWRLQKDSNFLVDIKDGVLHLEKFEKNFTSRGCLWYNKLIPGLNTLNDFSVTIYARHLSGGDIIDMFDLQWGFRDNNLASRTNDSLYQLSFLLRGEVKLDYFNKRWTYFVRKNVKPIIDMNLFRPEKMNKYELVQKDGFLIFSVNNKEYFKQFYNPIPGNSIGFQQCLKSAWEIDKIIVRQRKTGDGEKNILPSLLITSTDKHPQDNNTSAINLKTYPNPFSDYLNITFDLEKEETVQVYLIDIAGTVLQQHTKKLQKGPQNVMIYADVVPGSYVVKVQAGNEKTSTTTVIKQ